MIRRTRPMGLAAVLWLSMPALALVDTGCSLVKTNTNTNTNVADGKLYEPGEVEYDRFFKDLFDVQLLMGQGPEREQKARARVAKALDLPETTKVDALGDAIYERAAILTKSGTMVKLSLGGIERDGTPSGTVVTIGDVKNDKDKAFVDALDAAVKADVELLADLRKTRSPIERLRGRAAALEPRIDATFSGRGKRKDVRQNLDDARQLIPLMVARGDDLQRQTAHFLTQLQKVLGTPTSPEGPTPLPDKTAKKARPKKGGIEGKPVSKPAAPPRAVVPKTDAPKPKTDAPKAPPEAKKAPPEPKKKPPPEDFEP